MKMKMRREDQGTVFLSFPFSPTRGPAGKIPPPLVDLIYNVFGPFSFKTLNWTLHGHKLVLHLERWPLLFDFLTTISTNKLSIIVLCFITYIYIYISFITYQIHLLVIIYLSFIFHFYVCSLKKWQIINLPTSLELKIL